MKKLGKIRHGINVSLEYETLAKNDEKVAQMLLDNDLYRHSMYFYIQAMEKYIRAKIFTLVNPNIEYFRKKNQNHSLTNAIEFLIEIISANVNIKNQVKSQLDEYVFEGINFQQLHNNLRYPFYNEKYNDYSSIDYFSKDCNDIKQKLDLLKKYLEQLNKLYLGM